MAKHTLYTAQRFLIYLISVYGFNESNFLFKALNVLFKVVAAILALPIYLSLKFMWHLYSEGIPQLGIDGQRFSFFLSFVRLYFGANASCFFLCHFRKRKFNALLKILQNYDVSATFSRKFRKLQFIFGPFFLCFSCILWADVSLQKFDFLDKCLLFGIYFIAYLYLLCLPLCSLPVCVVSYYVNCSLHERTEEVIRSKSPLRKARMTTRLILLATRLNRLTSVTDDYGAPVMLLLKMSAISVCVAALYNGFDHPNFSWEFVNEVVLYYIPCLTFALIYVWYLRVAPSANQMPSLLARVMMENAMSDEQVMSREPISRIQLIRARIVQLAHLIHFNFDRKQFTVLGEAVDETDIFMAFVEVIDKVNTFNSTDTQ